MRLIPFRHIYESLIARCFDRETMNIEKNRRTDEKIRIVRGGASFRVDLASGILPTCGYRKTRPKIAAAEVVWCLRGERTVQWLRKYTNVWDQFVDISPCKCSDGLDHGDICDACGGTGIAQSIDAAYGYRWRHAFGRDQLAMAIEALKRDSTDRRIWISSWDPSVDGLGMPGQKTVPCPVGFTFSIVDHTLDSSLMIRSSDLFMGLPIDVMRHALLMDAVAAELSVRPGIMQITLAHPHLYERHWDMAETMIRGNALVPQIEMPRMGTSLIVGHPDAYMDLMIKRGEDVIWPAFDPKLSVVV